MKWKCFRFMILPAVLAGFLLYGYAAYLTEQKAASRQASASVGKRVYVGGFPVGIYMKTNGVLVVDTVELEDKNGHICEPAEKLRAGDYVIEADGRKCDNKKTLAACIQASNGKTMMLSVMRNGKITEVPLTPAETAEDQYMAGMWIRNDAQGIGTLTYMEEDGSFGALGHGISDQDTGTRLELSSGKLYDTSIVGVTKGCSGKPGELAGIIKYQKTGILGKISMNSGKGIFGMINSSASDKLKKTLRCCRTALNYEVKEGPAVILCAPDGEVKEYEAEIERIRAGTDEVNKQLVIKITDPRLLNTTGGIVQGMSGSPIMQNGKLIGAVTHVFVDDPAKGYGILIETMMK